MSDGSIRIINNSAGARWVGVSQQAFADVIRRHYTVRRPFSTFKTVESRVKEAFPELFKAQ